MSFVRPEPESGIRNVTVVLFPERTNTDAPWEPATTATVHNAESTTAATSTGPDGTRGSQSAPYAVAVHPDSEHHDGSAYGSAQQHDAA